MGSGICYHSIPVSSPAVQKCGMLILRGGRCHGEVRDKDAGLMWFASYQLTNLEPGKTKNWPSR